VFTASTIITLMMEAVHTSQTFVYFTETTWCYIPEGNHLHTCHHENLKRHRAGTVYRIATYNWISKIKNHKRFYTLNVVCNDFSLQFLFVQAASKIMMDI
jgi:hypothetical protein